MKEERQEEALFLSCESGGKESVFLFCRMRGKERGSSAPAGFESREQEAVMGGLGAGSSVPAGCESRERRKLCSCGK
jgi:hypothetical protein